MSTEKPRRLGRGLEALLTSRPPTTSPSPSTAPSETSPGEREALQSIAISEIRPNPYQPRKDFRPEELGELEASLRASGLLQPVTVRRASGGDGYELIAGERRLRAASRIGWTEIPALVRDIDDRTILTLALVENLQRADLNPVEEADGYQRLLSEFSLTQQQVADAVGKDRSTIANMLRLLRLPASIRQLLQDSHLTLGHARALLALGDESQMIQLAQEIVAKGMTVRDVEARGRAGTPGRRKTRTRSKPAEPERSSHLRLLEDEIRGRLQTDVRLLLSDGGRGTIEISFYSADDLDRVLDLLLGDARERG